MASQQILIYGSYGYTGALIVEACIEQGLKPVLAGRDAGKVEGQARALGLEYRVFALDNQDEICSALNDCLLVVNCAGPFSFTSRQMIDACIHSKTHYLDITGEYQVIEDASKRHEEALAAGVMLMPGAGFDVVPSDCLALYLKNRLPDASKLVLVIASLKRGRGPAAGVSRGTAKTMLQGLSQSTMMRDQGALVAVGAPKSAVFKFSDNKPRLCLAISWGDIASAFWSTGISHIETWMYLPEKAVRLSKLFSPFKRLVNWSPVKRFLLNKINQMPEGPSSEARANSKTEILGIVSNDKGEEMRAILTTANGYDVTALSVLVIVQKILAGEAVVGYQTPASAYGANLILEVPGSSFS